MGTADADLPGTTANAPALAPPRNTHFDFHGRVFQAPGAHFILKPVAAGTAKEAMFAVDMGSGEGLISLKDLRETFEIAPGSHDDQLIDQAAKGLRFVPDIRPGDMIPTEVLDGTASWTVRRRHKLIARDRIQAQLLTWMTGKPVDINDADALTKLLDGADVKKMLRDAFQKAAVALGLPKSQAEEVVDRIETVARELCYIEALRDRAGEVRRIRGIVESLVKVYGNDQRKASQLNRMKILMVEGVREVFGPLVVLDAKIADVMTALQEIDKIIAAIRETRDHVHFVLMQWDPVIARWDGLAPVRSAQIEKALDALYQLLASRFSTGKSLLPKQPG